MSQQTQIHGSCVAIENHALVLLGPSGCGKSDLALRLIDHGAALIADDRIDISNDGQHLIASVPDNIAGLIEVRGIGIIRIDHQQSCKIAAVFELSSQEKIDRLPEPSQWSMLDLTVPLFQIDPSAPSAAAKVRITIKALAQNSLLNP